MARRGAFQLKELVVHFCDFGGSSAGVRAFLDKKFLADLPSRMPSLSAASELRRGHHPYAMGKYANGQVRTVGLRNLSPEEVEFQIEHLQTEKGHRTGNRVKRHLTSRQSIQGEWKPT